MTNQEGRLLRAAMTRMNIVALAAINAMEGR